jgi:hypothetical protein
MRLLVTCVGQGEIEPVVVPRDDQLACEGKCGFGLSAAHRGLDDHERGSLRGSEQRLLHLVGRKAKGVLEGAVGEASARPADLAERGASGSARRFRREIAVSGEKELVGTDPIGDRHETGEQPEGGVVAAEVTARTGGGERTELRDEAGGDGDPFGLHLGRERFEYRLD